MSFEKMIQDTNEKNTFMIRNGIRITSLDLHSAEAEVAVGMDLLNLSGAVHGGVYFTMADACCGVLARADGRKYVTTDTSFHFLKPASGGVIQAQSTVMKRGRHLSLFQVHLRQKETGALLAQGAFTFYCTSEG